MLNQITCLFQYEEEKEYWICAEDSAGQDYFETHDVLTLGETTKENLPKTDNNKVRELDIEALQHDIFTSLGGNGIFFWNPMKLIRFGDAWKDESLKMKHIKPRYLLKRVAKGKAEMSM